MIVNDEITVIVNNDCFITTLSHRNQWSNHLKFLFDDVLRLRAQARSRGVVFKPEPPISLCFSTYQPHDEDARLQQDFYQEYKPSTLSRYVRHDDHTAYFSPSFESRIQIFNERVFQALANNIVDMNALDFEQLACFGLALHQACIPFDMNLWLRQVTQLVLSPSPLKPHRLFRLVQLAYILFPAATMSSVKASNSSAATSSPLLDLAKEVIRFSVQHLGSLLELLFQLSRVYEHFPRCYPVLLTHTTTLLCEMYPPNLHAWLEDSINSVVKHFHRAIKARQDIVPTSCLAYPEVISFFDTKFANTIEMPPPPISTTHAIQVQVPKNTRDKATALSSSWSPGLASPRKKDSPAQDDSW